MLIVEWAPITETEFIPPMGEALEEHLLAYRGEVKHASCTVWGLLYETLRKNRIPICTVAFTETGKPFFRDSTIRFSLSHTKGVCAVAVSDRPVGVDIELCKESYPPRLIGKSLAERERLSFDGDFTRIWCRKEAVAKMTGEGIVGYPWHIDTTAYPFTERQVMFNDRLFWLVTAQAGTIQPGSTNPI